ncbi:unnamed protein product [Adineta steineri]|uniref:Uncharacterized protein n=1 Tax=Adineta steineri TaxID=433720 RepID=A0A815CCV8_9BILA|nr:unnamed protein product [Adineta steineri]CAF3910813.1 unnamed protein product [Adineta steineri]
MTHIIRTIASSAILTINRSTCATLRTGLPVHVRTIFSSTGLGLENFKLAREQHISRHAPSLDGFKKRFLDSINKSDSQIFTEDLRNMIMSADTDEEIDGVIQALKKYNSNKLKFTDYHFGSPVMRLLYIRNKPDLAMKLFMDDSLKDIFQDSGSALILLNKLIEDKRFDDAVKVFEYGSERGFSTTSGRTYPTDVVMLTIEGLYRQNTKASLAKAKELISKVMQRDSDVNPRTASMIALLAIQQGEPSLAMEILGAVRAQNLTTIQNIRAICYAELGRVEEAVNVVHLLADQPPVDDDRRRVFPLVLQYIQKAVDKTENQDVKTRFEDLKKFVSTNNRLSTTDLVDFMNEPITRRGAILPNKQGAQGNSRDNYQRTGGNSRDSGFRGGYNQNSGNMRQRSGDGGYNRDNNRRFESGGYERRSQYSSNENERFSNRNEYSRQENSGQQTSRLNRNDNTNLRARDQNTSKRNETKPGLMETTSTSPIPQRSKQLTEDNKQQTRRKTDDQSSTFSKRDEKQSGGNTGVQQQSPWDQADKKSA